MKLNKEMIYPTEHTHVPEYLKAFQRDVAGPRSLLKGLRELETGKTDLVAFADCSFGENGWQVDDLLHVGIGDVEGKKCFRYTGESFRADGGGSHSVIPTWYDDCCDAAVCAVTIAAAIRGQLFRMQLPERDNG